MINLPPIKHHIPASSVVKRANRRVVESKAADRGKKEFVERRLRQDRRKGRQKMLMDRRLTNDRRRSVIDLSV
jgi:hypothetical protein